MTKILMRTKGEGYIDICVGIIALFTVLVLTLNIYSFLTLKQDLDEISEQLIETATYTGCFGGEFNERCAELKNSMFDFEVTTEAPRYYNSAQKKVQLGNTMRVTVYVKTKVVGVGVFNIPVTCKSSRSGISEKYWKG